MLAMTMRAIEHTARQRSDPDPQRKTKTRT
jgi:hypothetical protein